MLFKEIIMANTRKFLVTILSVLMCIMLSFAMVACGGSGAGDGDGDSNQGGGNNGGENPPPHSHEYTQVVEYFGNNRLAKKVKCSCGATIDRAWVEIYTAQDFIELTQELSEAGADIGTYKVEIKNDIDFNGATINPMVIHDSFDSRWILTAPATGITLKNFTINPDANGNAALFGLVKSDLTIENINIENATIGNATTCVNAAGFVAEISFEDLDTVASGDVVFQTVKIKDSTILATGADGKSAGGIYGIAINELGDERNVKVDAVEINNCDISCNKAAGAIVGWLSQCSPVQTLKVNIADYSIKNCDLASSTTNEAGLYCGIVGDAWSKFEYQSASSEAADKIFGNTVNQVAQANLTRDYGRADWSDGTRGYCWFGVTQLEALGEIVD